MTLSYDPLDMMEGYGFSVYTRLYVDGHPLVLATRRNLPYPQHLGPVPELESVLNRVSTLKDGRRTFAAGIFKYRKILHSYTATPRDLWVRVTPTGLTRGYASTQSWVSPSSLIDFTVSSSLDSLELLEPRVAAFKNLPRIILSNLREAITLGQKVA